MSLSDWYPFNVIEYRRDTYHLNAAQRGIYRALIDECMSSRRPLPDDDCALASIAYVSLEEWAQHSAVVRAFFAARNGQIHLNKAYCRPSPDKRPSADVWRRLRRIVFERDEFVCQYCGTEGGRLECDHVIPIAKGGSNDLENLLTACFSCNRSKHDKLLSDWRQ